MLYGKCRIYSSKNKSVRCLSQGNLQPSVLETRGIDRQVKRQVSVTTQVEGVMERMEHMRGKLN